MTKRVICVLGPTASGKSAVAQGVALALDGEVVSADSMQIYRGMDIGTAKITPEEMRVPHHLIDIMEPGESFSAQLFQRLARQAFSDIEAKGKVSVLCGGTGLYVQAALEDMRFPKGEQDNNAFRAHYEALAHEQGVEAVWEELNRLDAASAAVIHPNNVRRVIRALEMHEQGISYAEQVSGMKELPEVVPSLRFGLMRDAEKLAVRINMRVDAMFEAGLVSEVESLLDSGLREALTAPQAIGYKEVVAALDGNITMDQAREDIKTATRRYAKRQRSWLRRDKRVVMLDADVCSEEQLVNEIVQRVSQSA